MGRSKDFYYEEALLTSPQPVTEVLAPFLSGVFAVALLWDWCQFAPQ